MLSKTSDVMKKHGKKVLAVILFGSYIYNPRKARDIDILVIIDSLRDIQEKLFLEKDLCRELRKITGKPVDTTVFDLDSFKENLEVGTFLSGLALGYKIMIDEIGIEKEIIKFLEKLSKEKYILYNRYGTWNLGRQARITLLRKKETTINTR